PVRMLHVVGCVGRLLGILLRGGLLQVPVDRLVLTLANCWFSVGPTLVLYVAATRGAQWDVLPVYAAALAAQFALDSASTFVLARAVVPLSLRSHVRSMLSAYGFDTVLAPLGLLAAF